MYIKSYVAGAIFISIVNIFTTADCIGDQLSESEPAILAERLQSDYRFYPDLIYHTSGDWKARLDLYYPKNVTKPPPVLIYYHGGSWNEGSRKTALLAMIPYLEIGFAVVNVDYRLTPEALAPAAVIDSRCALHWVIRNAEEYNLDPSRIILSGHSAGGHLALMTGMVPSGSEFDSECKSPEPEGEESKIDIKVAGIINWYGITIVNDLIEGKNKRDWAIAWIGEQPDREEIAKKVSPFSYVRTDLPPILTIHGGSDPVVPYSHSVRLHAALHRADAPNKLVMVPGGKHGDFTRKEYQNAYGEIRQFLKEHGILGE